MEEEVFYSISTTLLPAQIKDFDTETQTKIQLFLDSTEAKKYLEPKHYDKFFVARFLRARKYDVNLAVQMFVSTMKWREEMNVENIRDTFHENPHFNKLMSEWPGSLHWTDPPETKDGSVVLIEALGRADPALIEDVGYEALIHFHIWCMEKLETRYWETVAAKGYWPGYVMIEDLEGVGYSTFSSSVLKVAQDIIKINQNYYPEMLRKMYIINVPSIFYMFWKGIQVWMEPRSVAKMELISGGVQTIMDKFAQVFKLEDLPQRLGGKSTRDLPVSRLTPLKKLKGETPVHVEIARGGKHEVTFHFKCKDVVIWEFTTKDYDIGFTITNNAKQTIQPYERHDSFKKVVSGSFTVEDNGPFLFQWDNSFSWTRGKKLLYNIYNNGSCITNK